MQKLKTTAEVAAGAVAGVADSLPHHHEQEDQLIRDRFRPKSAAKAAPTENPSGRLILPPPLSNGDSPPHSECLACHPETGGRLAALIFGAIDQLDDSMNGACVVSQ